MARVEVGRPASTGRSLAVRLAVLSALLIGAAAPARASVVLMDEYWLPEILQDDVKATEIDTEQTGDPMQAVAGYFSVLLENETGAPSVRFRSAATIAHGELPAGKTEARLWYRTDAWAGQWKLEVFVNSPSARRPVRALEAVLDGGGEGGRLIADDRWHQARGPLVKADEYDLLMPDVPPRACYIWLRPTEGWDIPHHTYVDRMEAVIVDGAGKGVPAPPPAQRVRPSSGTQTEGPGWIRWEAEDALGGPGALSDVFVPRNADSQAVLSNGTWVHKSPTKTDMEPLQYKVTVAEDGRYALWARGYWKRGSFRWSWDYGDWSTTSPDVNTSHWAMLQLNWLPVGWCKLGEVELSAGEHKFTVEPLEAPQGLGFDCWVLARDAFARQEEATR